MSKKYELTIDNVEALNGKSVVVKFELPEVICRNFNISSSGYSFSDAVASYFTGEYGMCKTIDK